ncbi:MAG: hypothetical protein AAF456_04175 [Planctomycetota bacterium]
MDFENQLEQAISRGRQKNARRVDSEKQKALSQEDIKNRHTSFRLDLSDYIEHGLKKLAGHFPGFEYETIYGSKGWGGAVYRDDLTTSGGKAGSYFSRVEITVKPLNEFNVVNISGKGTIKNKEMFGWNHFKEIAEAGEEDFREKIDAWILQYAEQFAAA